MSKYHLRFRKCKNNEFEKFRRSGTLDFVQSLAVFFKTKQNEHFGERERLQLIFQISFQTETFLLDSILRLKGKLNRSSGSGNLKTKFTTRQKA